MINKIDDDPIETCFSCDLKHEKVEAIGIWHCPNALCKGSGGAWFRQKLDSYKDNDDFTHSVSDDEWLEKGRVYNKRNKIKRDKFHTKDVQEPEGNSHC